MKQIKDIVRKKQIKSYIGHQTCAELLNTLVELEKLRAEMLEYGFFVNLEKDENNEYYFVMQLC